MLPAFTMYDELKRQVLDANLALVRHGLVVMTWGNASAIDRDKGVVAIKASGVPYERMAVADIVIVDLDGRPLESRVRPSSDLDTHLALYHAWPALGGVVHTHSTYATTSTGPYRSRASSPNAKRPTTTRATPAR